MNYEFAQPPSWRPAGVQRLILRGSASLRIGAIVIGLMVGAIMVPLSVGAFGAAYHDVWLATFGSALGWSNVLTLAATLILTALAAAIPYRIGLWNIGAEGQLFIGAWAAAGVSFALPGLAAAPLIVLMLLASAGAGAAWIIAPALARAYLQVNEIITTLLLNFVAVLWMVYWVTGPWAEVSSAGGISSKKLPDQTRLSHLQFGSIEVHWGLLLAVGLAVFVWLAFRMTIFGYQVKVVGKSIKAGTYAGMPTRRLLVAVMLMGGAMGGLAGAVEVMGNVGRYSDSLSNNTGYSGIVVAVLAGGSELGLIFAAVLFGALTAAGNALRIAGISSNAAFALMGLILLLAAVGDGIGRYGTPRLPRIRRQAAEERGR